MDNWHKLNAYVDGELDADEAAGIAKAAADDPNVARDIAALSQLKATLSRCGESFEGELPTPRRRLFSRRQPWLIAAAAAFVAIVVLLVLGTRTHLEREAFEDFALAEHQRWTASIDKVAINGSGDGELVSTSDTQTTSPTAIPDISNIGLRMISLFEIKHDDRPGWHVGYLGRNGCKASLFILTSAHSQDNDTPLTLRGAKTGSSTLHFWATTNKRYYLTATDMSEQRLEVVSKLLHLKTREQETPARDTEVIALQDQYTASASCTA